MTRPVLACAALISVCGLAGAPAVAADTVQRHLVFTVHDDQTTRTRTRQETDINASFNGTGATNVGMGGGVNSGVHGNVVDTQVVVDVILVTPDGALGCDVKLSSNTPPQRIWIGRDGTVRSTAGDPLDPGVVFLLSLLATHVIPQDAQIGTSWDLGKTRFKIAAVNEPLARINVDGQFGPSTARGTSEEGWADYDPARFLPTRADLTIVQHDETPTQSVERRRHLTFSLVTDSRAPH